MRRYRSGSIPLIFLALAFLGLPASAEQGKTSTQQVPVPRPAPCQDLKVDSITIKLESTTADDPNVDIAADRILLSYFMKNVGTLPIPASARSRTIIKRNEVVLVDGSIWGTFGAWGGISPGRTVGLYDMSDTFPHNMPTTYTVQVITDFKECSTENNQLSFTVDEAKLHPRKRQPPATNQRVPPVNALTCPDVKVVSLNARLMSTQLGNPAFATPRDEIRLEVTLENGGRVDVPQGKMLRVKILQNGTALYYGEAISPAKGPGSRWTHSYPYSFVHGAPTTFTYEVLSISDTRQCSTANKQMALTIDENLLHAQ